MGDRPATFDPERWAGLLTAAGAVLLCVGTALAPGPWAWLVVPAVFLILLACVSARDGFLLFGPFVRHELLRATRRTRMHLWVTLAPLVCGAAVVALHYKATMEVSDPKDQITPSQLADIASGGFLYIGWHLFLLAFILTTATVPTALTEDRESKRADFLLSTDLRGREIVVGRTLARMLYVLYYPAAVLPLMAALPLLFRVDRALVGFALTYSLVTLFSVAGLCALASVLAADKKASGRISVLFIMPYIAAGASLLYLQNYPAVWAFPGSPANPAYVSVADLVGAFNAGNPFYRFYGWVAAGGGDLAPVARDLPGYAAFHLFVGVVAFGLAAQQVRPASAAIGDGVGPGGDDVSRRPPVADRPVYWKEVYLHPLMAPARRRPRTMKITGLVLIWGPAALLVLSAVVDLGPYAGHAKGIGRFYPVIWAWIGTMSAARFALESLPRERERDALVSLLVTPLSARRIAAERLWGAVRLCISIPFAVLVLAVAGAIAGGLPWLSVPALMLAHLVFLFEMVGIGGLSGATAATVKSANARFGYYFAGLLLLPAVLFGPVLGLTGWGMSPVRFAGVGLIIPLALLASAGTDQASTDELPLWALGFLAGVGMHAAIGLWAWTRTINLFTAACDPAREEGPLLANEEKR